MADHECHLIAKLLKALEPFASTTITDSGQIIGLMREDFKRASSVITEARAAIAKAAGEEPFMTDQNNLPRSMLREHVRGFTVQTTADHLGETITQRTTAPGLDDVIGNARHLIAMSVCHLQDVQTREALIKMGWLPPEEAGALKAQVVGARITSGAVSEGGDHD